jgi:hypothetical protein
VIDGNSKWDREELYKKVWQFPLRKLAAEYNISDVGLAKICKKLKIPLPDFIELWDVCLERSSKKRRVVLGARVFEPTFLSSQYSMLPECFTP